MKGFFSLFLMGLCLTAQAIPVLQIDASSQDGQQIGKQLAQQIAQQYPNFAKNYDQYLQDTLQAYEWSTWLERAEQVRTAVPPAVREEIDELAQRLALKNTDELGDGQLSAHELWVLQILLEQDQQLGGAGFGVLDAASAVSGPLLGHNQYGLNHPALQALRAITLYQNDDEVLINIGFAGFVGVLTGYNGDGLFVAYLPSPQSAARMNDGQRMSIALHLRSVLEQHDRITQALANLMFQRFFTSHNLLLADNRQVQVLEQPLPSGSHLRSANSLLHMEMQWQRPAQIAVVDCFALRQSPRNCYDSGDIKRWQRLRELAQFTPQHPATVRDVQSIMQDQQDAPFQSLFTSDTVYSTIFLPLERRLFLYSAGSQTADGLPVYEAIELPLPTRYTLHNVPVYQQVASLMLFLALLGVLLLSARKSNSRYAVFKFNAEAQRRKGTKPQSDV